MILEDFSSGYWLAPDVDVEPYGGQTAVVREDAHRELRAMTGGPVVGRVGSSRFRLHEDAAVPAGLVAVPSDDLDAEDDVLLVERP